MYGAGQHLLIFYLVLGVVFLGFGIAKEPIVLLIGIVWYAPGVLWLVARDRRLAHRESDAFRTQVRRRSDLVWLKEEVRGYGIASLLMAPLIAFAYGADLAVETFGGEWKKVLRGSFAPLAFLLTLSGIYLWYRIILRSYRKNSRDDRQPRLHNKEGAFTAEGKDVVRRAFAFWRDVGFPNVSAAAENEFLKDEWSFASDFRVACAALAAADYSDPGEDRVYRLPYIHDEESIKTLAGGVDKLTGNRLGLSQMKVYWEPLMARNTFRLHLHGVAWLANGRWTLTGSSPAITRAVLKELAKRDRWHGGPLRLALIDGDLLAQLPVGAVDRLLREFPPGPEESIVWADELPDAV